MRLTRTPPSRLALFLVLTLILLVAPTVAQRTRARRRAAPPPLPSSQLRVHVLDIGQGDSTIIVSPTGKIVLVDAGNPGNEEQIIRKIRTYTGRQCRIDLFVASHPHADHIGSAAAVIRACRVARVLDSKYPSTTATYERYLEAVEASGAEFLAADPGQTFDLGGGANITVLSPIKPFLKQSELRSGANEPNANSVVMRLDHGTFSMLFTGDAEEETESRMMAGGANLAAKVLKVGHHGSRYASSAAFLRAVGARLVTISVGSDNNYGHPSPEALRRLRDARVRPYRTDLQGQITISSNGSTHRITTERTATDAAIFRGRRPGRP